MTPSTLVLDELFDAGDPRFVEHLRRVEDPKALARAVARWKRDPRDWARDQMLAYAALPLDRRGHELVVRRLFKHVEERRDHEAVGAFLVAFDRLIRRRRGVRRSWDWRTRAPTWLRYGHSPADQMPHADSANGRRIPVFIPPGARLFRYPSRHYLRRRAWRYFRRLGHQTPDAYVAEIAPALARYDDSDVAAGGSLLDRVGLLRALFGASDLLTWTPRGAALDPRATLADLRTAPSFPELWARPDALDPLLGLVRGAASRLVRVAAMDLVRAHHLDAFAARGVGALLHLLSHDDAEIRTFALTAFADAPDLGRLPLSDWLRLLDVVGPDGIATVVAQFVRHVRPARIDLPTRVALACHVAAPIARLGLDLLEAEPPGDAAGTASLTALAGARCAVHGRSLAAFALAHLGAERSYAIDVVSTFFDAPLRSVREGAFDWLSPETPGWNDGALWSRLCETPYDDVRMRLVSTLDLRSRLPGGDVAGAVRLWTTLLLAVHRGGREKLRALRQVVDEIARRPESKEDLLPALRVAVRSSRGPERRAGLAAVANLLARCPSLEGDVARALPELVFAGDAA